MKEENKLLTASEARALAVKKTGTVDEKVKRLLDQIKIHASLGVRSIKTHEDYDQDCDLWNTDAGENGCEFREARQELETLGYRVTVEHYRISSLSMEPLYYTKIQW